MRYDLVVNTFVRDALTKGRLTLHHGGEMWRPLVDVRDAAQAYVALVEAEDAAVRGEIFNLCYRNLRISELALRVQEALPAARDRRRRSGPTTSTAACATTGSPARRSRGSSTSARRSSIEESVADMVRRIRADGRTDFDNPRYYNIRWLQLLEDDRKAAGTARLRARRPRGPASQ